MRLCQVVAMDAFHVELGREVLPSVVLGTSWGPLPLSPAAWSRLDSSRPE